MMFFGGGGCSTLRWRMLVQGRWGHGVRMCLLAQRVCACGRVCRGARWRAFVSLTVGRMLCLLRGFDSGTSVLIS